jgi:hypothetical protein
MPHNPEIVCQQCQTKGHVETRFIRRKTRMSGGKIVLAIFTLGWSLLLTGLAAKQKMTEARCGNCSAVWTFG